MDKGNKGLIGHSSHNGIYGRDGPSISDKAEETYKSYVTGCNNSYKIYYNTKSTNEEQDHRYYKKYKKKCQTLYKKYLKLQNSNM